MSLDRGQILQEIFEGLVLVTAVNFWMTDAQPPPPPPHPPQFLSFHPQKKAQLFVSVNVLIFQSFGWLTQSFAFYVDLFFWFCFLSNLRWNKLQDTIPPEIGELKSLTHL